MEYDKTTKQENKPKKKAQEKHLDVETNVYTLKNLIKKPKSEVIMYTQKSCKLKKKRLNIMKKEPPKLPLNSFLVDHLLFVIGPILKTPWEKTNFFFASGYQLEIASVSSCFDPLSLLGFLECA